MGRRARSSRPGVNDRGTVLLMVLGVLALMAIIAVVYASVGKADRSTSAAMVRSQRIDEQVDQMSRYMADVIGRDVFATYAQEDFRRQGISLKPPSLRPETYDAPDTDVMTISQRDPDDAQWENRQRDGFYLFSPEGTITQPWRSINNPQGGGAPANRRDPRSPSDPYLAATEPTFVNRNSADWSWQDYAAREDYLNLRDWSHISNLTPSGNFVNLWALRNNFRAESGFQTDTAGKPRLSARLTLINPATGFSYPAANVNQDPDVDIGGAMRTGNLTGRARLNRPADWTRDQIGAFRSTSEFPEGNGSPYGVDDAEYMPYQWADADGDGFYDSRWGELVDISDPNNSRPVISNNGRARLFFAARTVDLTGLVNVNTAGNFQFEPKRYFAIHQGSDGVGVFTPLAPRPRPANENTRQPAPPLSGNWLEYRDSVEQSFAVPAGLTPADVDLQRLLRMSDAFYAYQQGGGDGVGYNSLAQPENNQNLPGDYRAYDPSNNRRNEFIGNAAYQAIDTARLVDLPSDIRFVDPTLRPAPNTQPYVDTLRVAANRLAFFDGYGTRRDPGRQAGTGGLNRYGRPFDEADELELRTFQGLNDPSRTSRLEAAVAGRFDGDPDTYPLSPLRDNRPAELERAGRDQPQPDLAANRPNDQNEYRKALLAAQIDVRRVLTAINGARPIIDPVRVDITDPSTVQLSEAAGTLKVDAARLVSRLVETGNWSFERDSTPSGPLAVGSPCQANWVNRVAANKEDVWDSLSWFEDGPFSQSREWFYRTLDNMPPGGPRVPPQGNIQNVTTAGNTENYTVSRLDLMREAFRAYLDCLLPYSQWGSDPRQRNRLDGPFPDAWDLTDPTSRHLAYGGNPELAYRMAAHLAVNLRDATDVDRRSTPDDVANARVLIQEDNVQTAVTLDLTPDAVIENVLTNADPLNGNQNITAPSYQSYQRDRNYPWPKLNPDNRFTSADDSSARTRMARDPDFIKSVQGTSPGSSGGAFDPSGSVKRVNIFGIEPQPFITQVTAMSMFVDTPPSSVTPESDDEPGAQMTLPGQPPPPPPEVTINVDRLVGNSVAGDPGNPDFLCVVVAFQLTNPFDTDIVLEPEDPSQTDSWYYLEYAKRYYRLVPQDDTTVDGMRRNAPESQRILRAGETRVFYATYPNSLEQISRRINRAQVALAERLGGTQPAFDSTLFEKFAKHEFGEYAVHVAPMYPETSLAIGAPGSGQGLTDVDLFSIGQPASPSVIEIGSGPSGEAAQPSFDEDDDQLSDNRRVVYLWRVLRDPDPVDGGPSDLVGTLQRIGPFGRSIGNWLGNDLLLDRLRDPSDRLMEPDGVLVKALIRPFPVSQGNSNLEIDGTRAGFDEPGRNALDNTGFSLISWVSIVRPTNPRRDNTGATAVDLQIGKDPDGKVPVGAMPPWCMETKPDNIYTPGFEQQIRLNREWSLNRVRGVDGVGTGQRYGNAALPYYKELNDLVNKHMTTATRDSSRQPFPANYPNDPPSDVDAKFVDRDLSVQFAELRGGKAYPSTSVQGADPREQYSIVDIDEERAPNGRESQFFDGRPRRFDEVAVEIHRLPPDTTDAGESQSTPSRALFSRVGDFLLPLAIGPWHDPSAELTSPTATEVERLDAKWTTLSEVLALACDYYSGPEYLDAPQGSTGTRANIFYKFARDTRSDPRSSQPGVTTPKADRGQLVLDAYTPYLDYNPGAIAYQWQPLNPSNNASLRELRDAPLGNGIPLALNILDKFRVAGLPAETQAKASDPRRCGPTDPPTNTNRRRGVGTQFEVVGRSQAYGSATRSVPGKININTAPLSVLRLLPMVSPSPDTLNPNDLDLFDSWCYDGRQTDDDRALITPYRVPATLLTNNPRVPETPAQRLWDPSLASPRQSPWDIAVSIVGYRDKSAMRTRSFNNQPAILVDFRDNREDNQYGGFTRSGRDDAFQINIEDPSQGGLRDARGFKSDGEIMVLDIRRSTDPTVENRASADGFPTAYDVENSITRLARDGVSNKSLAIDSVGYKQDRARTVFGTSPGTGTAANAPNGSNTIFEERVVADGADTIPDDYDEKLSIASAILNTLTVRSDVFCVWFVVHGYTPEDVQVDDGFPLVPSIARRYMMVVDRSNVDSPTARPRIVMFREVPMP